MSYTDRINLVITAAQKQNANDNWKVLDEDVRGELTFSVPLSASGANPPTHWGASTVLEQATFSALATMTSAQLKTYVNSLATQRKRTAVTTVDFKASLLVGTGDFYEYIASLGLKRINPPAI